MPTEPVPVTITLNRDGVVAPALRSMRRASEIVAFMLNSLAEEDLSTAPRPRTGATRGIDFDGEVEGYNRKEDFADWILERGFRDLVNGIRATLEEAYFYIDIARNPPRQTTFGELKERFERIRKAGNRMNFVQILAAVNDGLKEPLSFHDEFLSLQKVRNCLEHRHGIVAAQDVDGDNGMRLALPHLLIFTEEEGREVELQLPHFVAEGTPIHMRLVTRERFFGLGARATFSAAEFDEIAMACMFFTSDLGQKLPDVSRLAPPGH